MGSGRPRGGPGKALEEKRCCYPCPLHAGGQPGRVAVFLAKAQVYLFLSALQTGPLPGLCGRGTALCLLLLALLLPSPLSWGILQSSASAATEEQERCIPPRPSRHRSHAPSSSSPCPPGATALDGLQQPPCPRGFGKVGISLSGGQLSGWDGGEMEKGLVEEVTLGETGTSLGGEAALKSPPLSLSQELVL